jgi:hypothetical protein
MPIRRYVKNGVIFDPQVLTAMSRALEATTNILGIDGDEARRRDVARFIIRLAQDDVNPAGKAHLHALADETSFVPDGMMPGRQTDHVTWQTTAKARLGLAVRLAPARCTVRQVWTEISPTFNGQFTAAFTPWGSATK